MTQTATADDIVRRLTGTPYAMTAETGLGWGMGPAQLGIREAVDAAIADGRVRLVTTRDTTYGRGVRFIALDETYCPTCDRGCDCPAGSAGCEHYGCWGGGRDGQPYSDTCHGVARRVARRKVC
jgi:hypothetical protein